MLVAERYEEYTDTNDFDVRRADRFNAARTSRYDDRRFDRYEENFNYRNENRASERYDERYEAERRETSDSERERLMYSLEKSGMHSRLERSDENRYNSYAQSYAPADNNYDRMLERKAKFAVKEKKVFNRKKLPFVVAYVVFAFVALLAITLSVAGIGAGTVAAVEATAENALTAPTSEIAFASEVSALETPIEVQGGEMYVMLKSGELVALNIQKSAQVTEEKEKGFDKFCSWLNGIFGGNK